MSYRKSEPPPGLVDAQAAYIKAEKMAEAAAADQQIAAVDHKEAGNILRVSAILVAVGLALAYLSLRWSKPSGCVDTAHFRESKVECPVGSVLEVPNFEYVVCRCVRKEGTK